ncbi:MAG TPA: prepilin peptidase, partial [Gemmataceae bacterium]|nr:prepilin peptidase [Gemmataceae bacterium]
MALLFQLTCVFLLGASVGSFLNVCIARLPLEKSLLWPGSRCGRCLQPIRWYDNLPLLSYWILRGRCRVCGARFSVRYFLIELFTALSLVGLYYLEVVANIHHLDARLLSRYSNELVPGLWVDRYDVVVRVIFLYHAVLFCFLLVAAFSDLDRQAIPLSLTITGTIVGLVGAVVFAWPWPYTPQQALPGLYPAHNALYPWPAWSPLPDWLHPGGNWQTGLATGVAGVLAGTLILRVVRLL